MPEYGDEEVEAEAEGEPLEEEPVAPEIEAPLYVEEVIAPGEEEAEDEGEMEQLVEEPHVEDEEPEQEYHEEASPSEQADHDDVVEQDQAELHQDED